MATSVQKSGSVGGVRWNAAIEATPGGQFTIRSIDVTDASGKALPTYSERTGTHDSVEGAIAEAERLAKTIGRPAAGDEDDG